MYLHINILVFFKILKKLCANVWLMHVYKIYILSVLATMHIYTHMNMRPKRNNKLFISFLEHIINNAYLFLGMYKYKCIHISHYINT